MQSRAKHADDFGPPSAGGGWQQPSLPRTTVHGDGSACTGAVVRKPPRKEPAGDEVPAVTRALWRFDCGVVRWWREL